MNVPRSRVLVTGASGNVGREVVRHCESAGLLVRQARRPSAVATDGSQESVPFAFEDRQTWASALSECESVFLLRPPALADMDATLNPFVDAAYAAGVKHVVFLSVSGAERMSWVPHRKVELHLQDGANSWTLLRPGFFAQNLQDAYRRDIVEDSRLYVPVGTGKVAFLDVADVGAVCARILARPSEFAGKAYLLTGPEALSFDDVADILTRHLGRKVAYEPASMAGYLWHLSVSRRLPLMQAAIQTYLHVGLRRGDAEIVTEDVQRLLGRPAGAFEQYVQRGAETWGSSPAGALP